MDGFPELIPEFLAGQDVLLAQYNEVNFYVEDLYQENLYFEVLGRLFPGLRLECIFPLGGKDEVLNHVSLYPDSKDHIFIVDKDYDDLLDKVEDDNANVFYLDKYSLENLLLDEKAVRKVILEKHTTMARPELENKFRLDVFLSSHGEMLKEIGCAELAIAQRSLGLQYYTINPQRDQEKNGEEWIYNTADLNTWKQTVENALTTADRRFTLSGHYKANVRYFKSKQLRYAHVRGKIWLGILRSQLIKSGMIQQVSMASFVMKLAMHSSLENFRGLRTDINRFINAA